MDSMKTDATPGWTDMLRTAPGARLRLSIALKPAWRQMLARWLATRSVSLDPLDGAAVEVVDLSAEGGLLRSCTGDADMQIELRHEPDGAPALSGRLRHGERDWSFDVPGLVLQRGGSRESYVARTLDGQRLPWLKFSHARDGQGFAVTLFPGAFASQLNTAYRALLPSQIELLDVRIEA
jgi:hypothetical protein